MPPKKKTPATDEPAEEGGTFRWTLENERKLLILTQGRYLTSADYERLVKDVFPGTNFNGVKIKVSRFRVEQRNQYEQLGWELPEGGAGHGKRKGAGEGGTPGKKIKGKMEEEGEVEVPTPCKKARGKGGKKSVLKEEEKEEKEDSEGGGAVVKEEEVD
ncbi:hypothetical protein GQ44DRAFT_23025 [Phaeosphaeriaceae sp. PMI808]|nr:hypothetical protein GQ44DRAFT_23025 [Phaeosphaeriaceae sp. PMI808]